MKIAVIIFLLCQSTLYADSFPEQRLENSDLLPRPIDGWIAEVNPPGFAWLPVKKAVAYYIKLQPESNNARGYQFIVKGDNIFALRQTLETGTYRWTIEALDENGKIIATRRPYKLTIPAGIPEFPYPDIETVLARVSRTHPRLLFPKDSLQAIRASLSTTRKDAWEMVKNIADESLNLPAPNPPGYGSIQDYNTKRLEYRKYYHYIRPYIDEGLQALAIAWLMTGESKYAQAAKNILLKVASWDVEGITSCNNIGFDEPGLSFSRCIHRAYDWLYDALDENERAIVRRNVLARAHDTFLRVGVKRPFHQNPGSSHDGRLIGYLSEQALVLQGEAPADSVHKWLDYSLKAFWTVFPHWGGRDGGWNEGIGYATAYNIRAATWIESAVSATGLNLWRKPFFHKIRNFFLYCARPNDEFWPFGDGAERGPRHQPSKGKLLNILMSHYAQRFHDPTCQWWADHVPREDNETPNPIVPLILGKKVSAQPPTDRKNAAVFRGIGWAALHSDIADVDNDVFMLFKSSPYGSISHSHADQNCFYLSVGGRALAIPSGYYGPVYGFPHHAQWTRSTKANNGILVNYQGQKIRDFRSNGSIKTFKHGKKITYFCGEAARAYSGQLQKFDRHVLFMRPGIFVILDDLEAKEPSTFQWMLHALEKMQVNEQSRTVHIQRLGAQMDVKMFNSLNNSFQFSLTDQFDTPYNEGVEKAYRVTVPNEWHFMASTQEAEKSVRILAFVLVGNISDVKYMNSNGWIGVRNHNGKKYAEVWGRLNQTGKMPDTQINFTKTDAPVIGFWRTEKNIEIFNGEKIVSKKDE